MIYMYILYDVWDTYM